MSTSAIWINSRILRILIVCLFLLNSFKIYAQPASHLTIEKVYQLARKNYPLIKQKNLIAKTKDYSIANASKGYLPVLSVNGQATYQSEVTNFPVQIPIPGFSSPQVSKDQYKLYGEIDQIIYDGGIIKNQKQSAVINDLIQQQDLEVELYSLYDRVNQLFFGALLMDEQLKQNELLIKNIQNGIEKTKALVENGTAFRSSLNELQAQFAQAEQSGIELKATKKAYLDMLELFIGYTITENVIIDKPSMPEYIDSLNRPELLNFDYKKKTFDLQDQLLKSQLRPKLSLFIQGGYGRPGLNLLSNDFAWYSLGGVRLNWNLGSLYTLKDQKQLLEINRQSINIQKEIFVFNSHIIQKQQNAGMRKYMELINKDKEIIGLRESVRIAADAQLENGVLSVHDYITQVNAEDQARQTLILHEVQLLQSQYNYQNTMGNINK